MPARPTSLSASASSDATHGASLPGALPGTGTSTAPGANSPANWGCCRLVRYIAPGRPPPAVRAETPRARGRYAPRRLFPPPSAEGAATPPAPDAVSLRRPGFEQADEVLCLRPQPRALLQPPLQTPGATEPASAQDVSALARGIQRAGARRVRCAHHAVPSSAA